MPDCKIGAGNRLIVSYSGPTGAKYAKLTGLPTKNGAAFTGELKLVRKPTGYEKGRRPTGSWVAGLRERTFLAPFDASVTHRFL